MTDQEASAVEEKVEAGAQLLSVDKAVCEGYSICIGIDSDMFELDEVEDFVHIVAQPETAEQQSRAENAVRSCPKRALSFTQK